MARTLFRRWLRPGADILTVGLPFCVFKVLTGVIALTTPMFAPVGCALIALGAVVANVLGAGFARLPALASRTEAAS